MYKHMQREEVVRLKRTKEGRHILEELRELSILNISILRPWGGVVVVFFLKRKAFQKEGEGTEREMQLRKRKS